MNLTGHNSVIGKRQPAGRTSDYETPLCIQNAMMTKDKKPFTYTPGGIDLSKIKSERMAKRLARNAHAEGRTELAQFPSRPELAESASNAAALKDAAGVGTSFQVLPPLPPKQIDKDGNTSCGASAPRPPPLPPNGDFDKSSHLIPMKMHGSNNLSGSPNVTSRLLSKQRFEPPPMGFRPEIKIPPNPLACLRKITPPVEKNSFWKDEYVKERSKSPRVSVDLKKSSATLANDVCEKDEMALKKVHLPKQENWQESLHSTALDTTAIIQQKTQPQPSNPENKTTSSKPQTNLSASNQIHQSLLTKSSPKNTEQVLRLPQREVHSVPIPQSPAITTYTSQRSDQQSDVDGAPEQKERTVKEGPLEFRRQKKYFENKPLDKTSQLDQASQTSGLLSTLNNALKQANTVPWRSQRHQGQSQQEKAVAECQLQQQSHEKSQRIANNIQIQYGCGNSSPSLRGNSAQTQPPTYEHYKPANIGSLYISPLTHPTDSQSPHTLSGTHQQNRDLSKRKLTDQVPVHQLPWISTHAKPEEQPERSQPENGIQKPSSLLLKSTPAFSGPQKQKSLTSAIQPQIRKQQQQFCTFPDSSSTSFEAHSVNVTGLRSRFKNIVNTRDANNQSGPKEHIIPIQLETSPSNSLAQLSFNHKKNGNGNSTNANLAGYLLPSPNQFVDQGYNTYPHQQKSQRTAVQHVSSPNQPFSLPKSCQPHQHSAEVSIGDGIDVQYKSRIIPIAIEGVKEETHEANIRSQAIFHNDLRAPPIQSKSFRILQKITDTADDVTADDPRIKNSSLDENELAQLQRSNYACEMSPKLIKRNDGNKRLHIAQAQDIISPQATKFNQCLPYDQQKSVPSIVHQVLSIPEPEENRTNAKPSQTFELKTITTPENAGPGQSDL